MNRLLAIAAAATLIGTASAHDADGPAGRKLGKVNFLLLQPRGGEFRSAPWRCCTRSGTAPRRSSRRSRRRIPGCAPRQLGLRLAPHDQPLAGQGRCRQRSQGAGRDRRGAPHRRRPSASATTSRRSRRTTPTSPASPSAPAGRARRRLRRRAAKCPTDDRRRSSPRSTSPARRASPTRPTPRTSRPPPSSSRCSKYPDHPGVAHYLIHSYDAAPIAAKGLEPPPVRRDRARGARAARPRISSRAWGVAGVAAINLRSFSVAKAGNEGNEAYHAMDYAGTPISSRPATPRPSAPSRRR